jgi:hypothetical protein
MTYGICYQGIFPNRLLTGTVAKTEEQLLDVESD